MTSMRAAMGVKKRYASLVAALQADGTLAAMQVRLLGLAEERGMMRWEYGAIDGAFSPWEGWRPGRRPRGQGQREPDSPSHRGERYALGEPDHTSQRG